jgi:putative membrane protein
MLVIKALHIISMVAWFAGLFYLPRLFVYHCESKDPISNERFKIMEKRLYFAITWPAAIVTTILGHLLIMSNPDYYLHAGWMHVKLILVGLLWLYHLGCGHFRLMFAMDANTKSSKFYRVYNEIPTLLLVGIVFAVVLK